MAVVDRAGVESLVDGHDAHTGLDVTGQDGPLHRRRASPPGQEREVDIDHWNSLEDVRLDELAEGDNDAELDRRIKLEHIVDLAGDGNAGGGRGGANRAGDERSPTTA